MKGFYETRHLVSFGNYLLSKDRKLNIREELRRHVTDADLANWEEEHKNGLRKWFEEKLEDGLGDLVVETFEKEVQKMPSARQILNQVE